jgi:hypothetical protein
MFEKLSLRSKLALEQNGQWKLQVDISNIDISKGLIFSKIKVSVLEYALVLE